jgi:hypothetical protein
VVGVKGEHNFTVSRMIPNPLPLREYFHNLRVSRFTEDSIVGGKRTIAEFGQTIGRLHARGISHGDLRWSNIIIDSSDSDNSRYVLLDNERTRRYRRLPDRKRLKNLVQLNLVPDGISRTDKLRFFYAYLKANPELTPHRKEWIRRVLAKTDFRLEQKARKRALLADSK